LAWHGTNPDVVPVGTGAELTFEVVKAANLLRVRVVNVTDLMVLGTEGTHLHALTWQDFGALFTPDCAVHFNCHGYGSCCSESCR